MNLVKAMDQAQGRTTELETQKVTVLECEGGLHRGGK
jgi:hypothetical protein